MTTTLIDTNGPLGPLSGLGRFQKVVQCDPQSIGLARWEQACIPIPYRAWTTRLWYHYLYDDIGDPFYRVSIILTLSPFIEPKLVDFTGSRQW